MLELSADWDDDTSTKFKKQYSVIQNNELKIQLKIWSQSSNIQCLIARLERLEEQSVVKFSRK